MRYCYRKTLKRLTLPVFTVAISLASEAFAQVTTDINGTPILLPSTSSSYNQNGFNLPSLPTVSGQDIVRGSGGLSCHSAVGSGGPNFDMGLIGSNDIFNRESVSVYGRVTVPLGKRPKRVDCTKLYDLEISRLRMELQLLRAGAFPGMLDQRAAQTLVTQAPTQTPTQTPTQAPPQDSGFSIVIPEKTATNIVVADKETEQPSEEALVKPLVIGDASKVAPAL